MNITNAILREKRILGRMINGKKLPAFTYRWDSRDPRLIRAIGFKPWSQQGCLTLVEHVRNIHLNGTNAGRLAKFDSQFVSTGGYGMLKKLDPVFAQQVLNTNLYRINTEIASATGKFWDVNEFFDKANIIRPYPGQREWAKEGGIPPRAVVEYMTGKVFVEQYDFVTGAPDEQKLEGWRRL
ncbi:hypothetical protein [Pseudomonas sp. FEN]|uniref:scabin-related ADP-ribosyltransferase n=1 Tax=Pseudomonas sp. FEN TaxID=2767468 RepID=UPI00174D678A|nr:hypothetical protein [Pseudomonas sp. FEN]CAD5203208.1 hypothetical protein [Pseudomonas sp. FEN]